MSIALIIKLFIYVLLTEGTLIISVHAYGLLALEAPLDVLVPRLLAQLAQAPRHRLLDRGEARVALEGADGALVEGVAAADEGAVRRISRLWELFCIIILLFIFIVCFVYCLFLFIYVYLGADRAGVLVHVAVPAPVEEAGRDQFGRHVARRHVHDRLARDEARVPHLCADVGAARGTPVMLLQNKLFSICQARLKMQNV